MPLPEADTATVFANTHDLPTNQARRRSRSTRSPSVSRSSPRHTGKSATSTKRSPSPIVSFQSSSLSSETPHGVKNITRKVIKRLEGLGHLEVLEPDMPVTEEEEDTTPEEEKEIEMALYALGKDAINTSHSGPIVTNGHANGKSAATNGHVSKPKPDLEIPRKLLHGSIGFFTLYLYVSEGDVRTIVLVLWMALAIIVPADLLRFNSRPFARIYEKYLGFLMRESERNSINGVVWYILGVNFVLSLYPQDVATVAILILSWADTAASTFGRLYGSAARKLPPRLPILPLPLAPRKSLVGFAAAAITGAVITFGFWGFVAPMRAAGQYISWAWDGGVRQVTQGMEPKSLGGGGAAGLIAISLVAGFVSGVSEALDLGDLDDNLTLPIISGGCILGFLKLLGLAASRYIS